MAVRFGPPRALRIVTVSGAGRDSRSLSRLFSMAEFARLCGDAGLQLDVVVWPVISHWGADYSYDAWHGRISAAWAAAGIEVIDLRETFAGQTYEDLRANSLDAHPNERASELVAERLLPLF